MLSAFSVMQLDAAQGEEQLNLAHHETEKSPGFVQLDFKTIPADRFFFPFLRVSSEL